MYHKLINEKEFFIFEKEENVTIPFGLQVLNVEPYGLVDSFKINTWLVGNLNPSPSFGKSESKICFDCTHFFYFMGIDPFRWPPRYGCSNYNLSGVSASDEMKQWSKEFIELEKKGISYVIFPDPFKLFEVFCPNVDLFDTDQKDHSHNLLISTIEENLGSLFHYNAIFPPELEIPQKMESKVDFQYDQRKKLIGQTFDPTKVPKWTCPNYEFDPNWREKLTRLDQG